MVRIDQVVDHCVSLMESIQADMFARALEFRNANTRRVDTWEEFLATVEGEGGAGFILAHWDGTQETEDKISEATKATIRCIPLVPLDPDDAIPGKCVFSGAPSNQRVVFAKAY
jgi:prolyl-tRNA synthetase